MVTVMHNYNMELHVLCIYGIVLQLSICICQAYSYRTSQMAVAVAQSVQ